MRLRDFLLILLLFPSLYANCQTAYQAGYIRYEQIGEASDLTIRTELTLYQEADAAADSVQISFGDGSSGWALKVSEVSSFPPGVLRTVYETEHTYPGISSYVIQFSDCCWTDSGINSVGMGGSEFLLSEHFTFPDPTFDGINNSPDFSFSPHLLFGETEDPLSWGLGIYDTEGDSVYIELSPPPNANDFSFPDEIAPGPDNMFTLSGSGQLIWDAPPLPGIWHFGYILYEFRDNVMISEQEGVMAIFIEEATSTHSTPSDVFAAYPNPVSDFLRLPEAQRWENYEITDLSGRSLLAGKTAPTLDLRALPAGGYVLCLYGSEGMHSELLFIR